VQPRTLNLGVLFRAPSLLRLNADINYETEAATPMADVSVNGTVVVTSTFVTPRDASSDERTQVRQRPGTETPLFRRALFEVKYALSKFDQLAS
jgi:hypothetical protein